MPVASDVALGARVVIHHPELVNLYGCRIGDDTRIGSFVEIQRGVVVGRACKISSHIFICEGVAIGDEVFVGHGVMFINDKAPRATAADGRLAAPGDWSLTPTRVAGRASIGSGVLIMGGVTIGAGALIGAGAVIACDVAPHTVVAGVPARMLRRREE